MVVTFPCADFTFPQAGLAFPYAVLTPARKDRADSPAILGRKGRKASPAPKAIRVRRLT